MKNKILVQVLVPEIEASYDVYIPVSRKVGTVIKLLNKAIYELSDGNYNVSNYNNLYSQETGERYDPNQTIKQTNIRNSSSIVLL